MKYTVFLTGQSVSSFPRAQLQQRVGNYKWQSPNHARGCTFNLHRESTNLFSTPTSWAPGWGRAVQRAHRPASSWGYGRPRSAAAASVGRTGTWQGTSCAHCPAAEDAGLYGNPKKGEKVCPQRMSKATMKKKPALERKSTQNNPILHKRQCVDDDGLPRRFAHLLLCYNVDGATSP